jgi:acetylornithine deacetylase
MIARMGQVVAQNDRMLDEAVERLAERAFAFLERLVAARSDLGREAEAQDVVAGELARLGFEVDRIELPPDVNELPGAGVSTVPSAGRPVVVGRRSGQGRSLLLNGHVDVVPPNADDLWATAPFEPVRQDGWLHGRGAGDMKSGFAMTTLAIEALLEADPAAIAGPLSFVSVIEEECTGNGTLAAAHAGVLADAVVLPECTGLELLLSGAGILWVELEVRGRAAHAHAAQTGVNAIEAALPLIEALHDLERELNEGAEGGPFVTNVGTLRGGDWQSSVPALATVGVRIGFPPPLTPAAVAELVVAAIDGRAGVRFNGFRAEAYALEPDHALARAVARAHESVLGSPPGLMRGTATTDARFYLNQFGVPALCYGPRARDIHGIDEAVELQSIVDGARVLARFIRGWVVS